MTTGLGAYDVQTAMYGVLSADGTFDTLTGSRIYWDVPDNTAYPYYAMGETTDTPADTFGIIVHEVTVTHHVWDHRDNYHGPKNVKEIMEQSLTLLDRVTLTIAGGTHVGTLRELDQITRPDSDHWHGLITYRVFFQES